MNITARDIIKLLRKRHEEDVFYTEVTIEFGRRRMDAWAMKKSWANALVTAYEIKVNRQDFLQDKAIPDYMDFCNEMYVVAPRGVLEVDELPEGCGYIEVSKNGARLFTKKKAKYRECVLPEQFLRSILFAKAGNIHEQLDSADRALARRVGVYHNFENFLEDEKALRYTGAAVSRKITGIFHRNETLEYRIKELEQVKRWKDRAEEVFGWHVANLLERDDAYEDILKGKIDERLKELNHPEQTVLSAIENLQVALKNFTDVIRGSNNETV